MGYLEVSADAGVTRRGDAMRNILSLIVLTTLLLLLWGYWAQIRPAAERMPAQAGQAAPARPLLAFEPSKVSRVEFRQGASTQFSLKRGEGQAWGLVQPFEAKSDTYLTERALTILAKFVVAQSVSSTPESLGQYGLGPEGSVTTVVLEEDGARRWLELGGPSVNGTLSYARSSDWPGVVLISNEHFRSVPREAADLLDRRIFPLAQDPLRTIQVTHGGATLTLEAGGTGWMIAAPFRTAADARVMSEWLKRLAGLSASNTLPLTAAGGRRVAARSLGTIRMVAGQTGVETVFLRDGPVILVQRSDQPALLFELPPDTAAILFPEPFSLRDKHLVQGETEALAGVEVRHDGRAVPWTRTASGWVKAGQPSPGEGSERMGRWLADLHLIEGSAAVPTLESCRVDAHSRWTVSLRTRDGRPAQSLQFARTKACGDVATLPTGEWVRLSRTDLLNELAAVHAREGGRG